MQTRAVLTILFLVLNLAYTAYSTPTTRQLNNDEDGVYAKSLSDGFHAIEDTDYNKGVRLCTQADQQGKCWYGMFPANQCQWIVNAMDPSKQPSVGSFVPDEGLTCKVFK
jgi:hypothetical protein